MLMELRLLSTKAFALSPTLRSCFRALAHELRGPRRRRRARLSAGAPRLPELRGDDRLELRVDRLGAAERLGERHVETRDRLVAAAERQRRRAAAGDVVLVFDASPTPTTNADRLETVPHTSPSPATVVTSTNVRSRGLQQPEPVDRDRRAVPPRRPGPRSS
jgi:hypothetical protein